MISVIIPTLNAARHLPACFGALAPARSSGLVGEVTVVDGGSDDATRAVAGGLGAVVVTGLPGRGPQMVAGAKAATGDWLLFLHADTVLDVGWPKAVADFMSRPGSEGRAAAFAYRLDDPCREARIVERVVAWRGRRLKLPYGDQGLLISRRLYREVGGFKPWPLMEDVDLARRLGGRRLVILDCGAVTSAAKYRASGYGRRVIRNLGCLGLYYLGVPPRFIHRLYY